MSGRFYVYEHWRPDKNACFYVGYGCGKRANSMADRNRYHSAIQAKLSRLGTSVEVRIIFDCLEKEDALRIEVERIAFWISQGVDLANMTSGGEQGTVAVYARTPEHRAKLSAAKKGKKLSPEHAAKNRLINVGRKHTATSIENMSKAQQAAWDRRIVRTLSAQARENMKGRKNFLGHKHTPEAKEKLRKANLGKKLSPEHAAKARVAGIGYKHTPEMREKNRVLSLGNKHGLGYKHTPEAKEKNRKLSKEMWEKRSDWHHTPETKEKIKAKRAQQTIQKHTPEAREKMSIASKAMWARRKAAQLQTPETVH